MTLSEYLDELETLRKDYGNCRVVITSVRVGVEVNDVFHDLVTSPNINVYCDKGRDFVSLGTIKL